MMKIVVINGTDVKGCTFRLKESFLEPLRSHEVKEFYLPSEGPSACIGCQQCFTKGEEHCPHYAAVAPIWKSIMESDLVVFAYPVYVLGAPGQVKTRLDHLAYNWIVHRPKKAMFHKRAVILTQSLGATNRPAQKDVSASLNWLGISSIHCKSFRLIQNSVWSLLTPQKQAQLLTKARKFGSKFKIVHKGRYGLRVRAYFQVSRVLQRILQKKGTDSLDLRHWVAEGFIAPRH